VTAQECVLWMQWGYWVRKVYDKDHGVGAFKALPMETQAQVVLHEISNEDFSSRLKEAL